MARRKAPPTEDALSGRASGMVPADSVYLSKSIKSEFIYFGLANRYGLTTRAAPRPPE